MTRLAELKVINCCQTRYSTGDKYKAVDKRARLLQGEYKKKAKDVDRQYGGTREGIGPVENKLIQYGDLQGLVVGAFGEGSEDLHGLVQLLAESKVNTMGLSGEEKVLRQNLVCLLVKSEGCSVLQMCEHRLSAF